MRGIVTPMQKLFREMSTISLSLRLFLYRLGAYFHRFLTFLE